MDEVQKDYLLLAKDAAREERVAANKRMLRERDAMRWRAEHATHRV